MPAQKYVIFKEWSIGKIYHIGAAAIEKETEKQITIKYDWEFYNGRTRILKEDVLLIISNRTKAIEMRDLFKESSRRYRASIERVQADLMDEYEDILKYYRG